MSTLKIDTLIDYSRELAAQTPNSVDAKFIVEGSCKFWVNVDAAGSLNSCGVLA